MFLGIQDYTNDQGQEGEDDYNFSKKSSKYGIRENHGNEDMDDENLSVSPLIYAM